MRYAPATRNRNPALSLRLLDFKVIHHLAGTVCGSGNFYGPLFLIGASNDAGQSDNPFVYIDIDVKRSNFRFLRFNLKIECLLYCFEIQGLKKE
jgi:hypothetical protein